MASEKSLNILFLADHNSIHDKKWATWISENTEHNCFLISREKHGKQGELWEGVNFLGNIPDYSVTQPWKNRRGKSIWKDIVLTNSIDLVHIYYAEPNALWAKYLSKLEIPVGITTRGSDVLIGMNHFLERRDILANILTRTYRKALQKSTFIISTSLAQKDRIGRFYLGNDSVHLIRTGIDSENIKKINGKKIEKKKQIVFGRNMKPLYNHHFAIDSLKSLPENIKNTYEFVFLDKDSSNREYVQFIEEKIAANSDLKITFLNLLQGDEYYKLLAESAVNVMTPLSDGSPVSGIETLALGTNLVLPELYYDEELFGKAHYYEQHNEEDFVKVIVTAIENPIKLDSEYVEIVNRNKEMKRVAEIYLDVFK